MKKWNLTGLLFVALAGLGCADKNDDESSGSDDTQWGTGSTSSYWGTSGSGVWVEYEFHADFLDASGASLGSVETYTTRERPFEMPARVFMDYKVDDESFEIDVTVGDDELYTQLGSFETTIDASTDPDFADFVALATNSSEEQLYFVHTGADFRGWSGDGYDEPVLAAGTVTTIILSGYLELAPEESTDFR